MKWMLSDPVSYDAAASGTYSAWIQRERRDSWEGNMMMKDRRQENGLHVSIVTPGMQMMA